MVYFRYPHAQEGAGQSFFDSKTFRYGKAIVKGAGSVTAFGSGVVVVGGCIALEPCGLIVWAGGGLLVVGGSIGTVDTFVDLNNIQNNRHDLPVLERLGNAYGGMGGQAVGKNLQSALDLVNVTQSGAGVVSAVEAGEKIRAIEVLDTTNTVDDLVRGKK